MGFTARKSFTSYARLVSCFGAAAAFLLKTRAAAAPRQRTATAPTAITMVEAKSAKFPLPFDSAEATALETDGEGVGAWTGANVGAVTEDVHVGAATGARAVDGHAAPEAPVERRVRHVGALAAVSEQVPVQRVAACARAASEGPRDPGPRATRMARATSKSPRNLQVLAQLERPARKKQQRRWYATWRPCLLLAHSSACRANLRCATRSTKGCEVRVSLAP